VNSKTAFCSVAFLLCSILASPLAAQQEKCAPPVALPSSSEPNFFADEKEVYLGDAVAEHIQKYYRVIEDQSVIQYLSQIGERLTANLPLTKLRFRFFLVDLPDANAFVLPGGRIYVSRKLVATARNEDELAGVIAHELGHLVAHEAAIDMTRRMREVLGVTSVNDRADVYDKYNQLIESARRKPAAPRDREKGQMVADQAGLYALIRAGYDPSALTRFWDRITETKGKTGNWLSDLFGTTRPEERRLREMIKTVGALPAECLKARTAAQSEEFKEWQSAVVGYTGLGRRESLHGVLSKTQLSPPLRSDITHLRFSPDGAYILAQDDSGISVLSREPFTGLFRIEAADAKPAYFSPDSKNIVFSNDNLRVEKWGIVEQKMLDAKEIVQLLGCLQTSLSPDGKFMACLSPTMDLNVLDVASGQSVIHRKDFFEPRWFHYYLLLAAQASHRLDNGDAGLDWVKMSFSPDGHYFVAGFEGRDHIAANRSLHNVEAFDLTTMKKISVPDLLQRLIVGGFTFMGSDRVAGINIQDYKKSAVVTFPEGKLVSEFSLRGNIDAPTLGEYLLIRPIRDFPLGVFDLNTKVIFKSNKQPALDIFGDLFVAEMRNGELGLYRMEKNQLTASTLLSNISIGRLRASYLSADMKWLALSSRSRGGVWNLEKGDARLYLRGFRGAFLSDDGFFYGDFPKFETADRNVAKFNLQNGEIVPGPAVEAASARQMGPYMITFKSARGNTKEEEEDIPPREWRNLVLNVFDVRTNASLWSRNYPKEGPGFWGSLQYGTAVLLWSSGSEAALAAIKSDPQLTRQSAGLKEKEGNYLLEVVDIKTGNSLGRLLIDSGKGSFRVANAFAAGDWVVVSDTQNRVLVYSLKTGEQRGRVFGGFGTVALQTGLLCVENETGKVALYDLNTFEKRDEMVFSSPISMLQFSPDGRRLFVLTTNQTVYLLDVSSLASKAPKE
jgi:WD40 repeat protein